MSALEPGPAGGEARAAPPRWGLGDALGGWLLGTLGALVVVAIWAGEGKLSLLTLAVGQLGLWTGLLGSVLWASRRKGAGSLGADFGLQVRWRDAGVGVFTGLVSQLLLVPLIYLPLRLFLDDPDVGKPARELARQARGPSFIAFAAVVIVVAPFVEELFFRGLVLRALQRRFGSGPAVGGSALAFGLAHFQLLQLPALVALGVVLGVMAVRFLRLGPGILAHAAFNALAVAGLYASR